MKAAMDAVGGMVTADLQVVVMANKQRVLHRSRVIHRSIHRTASVGRAGQSAVGASKGQRRQDPPRVRPA